MLASGNPNVKSYQSIPTVDSDTSLPSHDIRTR